MNINKVAQALADISEIAGVLSGAAEGTVNIDGQDAALMNPEWLHQAHRKLIERVKILSQELSDI